ncbi:MAG TPA: acyltransferase [Acidobacteriaceae bacterium]
MGTQTSEQGRGRIASLDGLRAVALLLVVLLHLGERFDAPKLPLAFVADGVGIFFVLSGFLITTLLLREYGSTGRIDLPRFYLRRTFRILPPLYFYLGAVVLLSTLAHVEQHGLMSAGLFYRNLISVPRGWMTEHTWSLSLEEQFYLLWPFALVVVLGRRGRDAAAWLALGLIVCAPVVRVTMKASHLPMFEHRESYFLFARMDALMCGCLLAMLVGKPWFERAFAHVARLWWVLPLQYVVVSGLLNYRFTVAYRMTVGMTLDSIAAALFILWASRNVSHPVGRLLNCRPMVALGTWSYSAYLWQTIFTHAEPALSSINRMPWALLLLVAVAWVSYRWVEQPALLLRVRLSEWLSRRRKGVPLGSLPAATAF